jgi:hypothetical protein
MVRVWPVSPRRLNRVGLWPVDPIRLQPGRVWRVDPSWFDQVRVWPVDPIRVRPVAWARPWLVGPVRVHPGRFWPGGPGLGSPVLPVGVPAAVVVQIVIRRLLVRPVQAAAGTRVFRSAPIIRSASLPRLSPIDWAAPLMRTAPLKRAGAVIREAPVIWPMALPAAGDIVRTARAIQVIAAGGDVSGRSLKVRLRPGLPRLLAGGRMSPRGSIGLRNYLARAASPVYGLVLGIWPVPVVGFGRGLAVSPPPLRLRCIPVSCRQHVRPYRPEVAEPVLCRWLPIRVGTLVGRPPAEFHLCRHAATGHHHHSCKVDQLAHAAARATATITGGPIRFRSVLRTRVVQGPPANDGMLANAPQPVLPSA